MPTHFATGLVVLTWLVTSSSAVAGDPPTKPNIILILADDLGAVDLGCDGNIFHETPHLDKLAADGMRFTTAYSACTVCSPTRAALLTGQYPARLHITDWIAGHKRPFAKLQVPNWTMYLPTETNTLAEAFRAAGYATASVGKWHLGGPDYYPEQHGFDVNIGGTQLGSPGAYFPPYRIATLPDGPKDEHLSDRLTREACDWIAANKEKSFLLYLPHYAVHTPLDGKPAVIEKYRKKAEKLGVQKNAVYAALVESLDDSIGTLRQTLNDLKLAERTVIMFTSDNGGLIAGGGGKNPITTNPPFRAGKGSAYEGGVRVPFLVYWPGVTKAGTTCDLPVITHDLYPTLAVGCGLKIPEGQIVDGMSLYKPADGLFGGEAARELYWHYPHYHPGGATPYSAIRDGDWRLVEFFEDNRIELYNLKADPGESKDQAAAMPDKAKELRAKLAAWRTNVGAQLPTPNPHYDPQRAAEPERKKK